MAKASYSRRNDQAMEKISKISPPKISPRLEITLMEITLLQANLLNLLEIVWLAPTSLSFYVDSCAGGVFF